MIADAMRMQRMSQGIFAIVFFLTLVATGWSQTASSYPKELYAGENIITFRAPDGIRSIEAMFDSLTASMTEIHGIGGIGDLSGCLDSHKVQIRVNTASVPLNVRFKITDCKNKTQMLMFTNRTWRLDEVPFPDAEVGDTICRPFQIGLNGIGGPDGAEYLDSISVMTPDGYATYSFPPPLQLTVGANYRYNVCFIAKKPGVYRFPVITWMRRREPADGYTNYAVADTGVVRVVRKINAGFTEVPMDTGPGNVMPEEPVKDPTIFRSIAVPNAVIPPKGTAFVGSYDLLGLTAGYAVADELLIFVGGAPPLPDDWGGIRGDMFWAFGAGAKLGTELFDKFNIAGGYAFAMSTLDKEFTVDELDSRIRLHIPYASVSYGTDDMRGSITGGLAFKRHSTWILGDPFFGDYRKDYDTTAAFISAGGDYRFGQSNWKIAAEGVYMQTLDLVPVMVTARYFTNSFALELGAGYAGITLNGAQAPKIPIFPVLSAIFTFGGRER